MMTAASLGPLLSVGVQPVLSPRVVRRGETALARFASAGACEDRVDRRLELRPVFDPFKTALARQPKMNSYAKDSAPDVRD